MFPEVMSGDDTEDTNSEERPLYTLLGKDNNNQSFGHTWCFMPSRALWVFRWIFEHAVPILHPGTACKRVQLIPTDADAQETRAIEAVCGPGKIYELASHLHCAFHKLDRNLKSDSKYKSKIGSVREKGVNSKAEIDMLLRWLWYFCKHYENGEQVDLALTLLHYYLREDEDNHFGEIGSFRKDLRDFITKSFNPNREKLFAASFEGKMTLGTCTTSINECEHKVIKYHCQGPKPIDDIAESASKIEKINEGKEELKSQKVAFDNDTQFAKSEDRNQDVDGLTDFVTSRLNKESAEASHYLTHRSSEHEYLVKRDYDTFDTSQQEDLELPRNVSQSLSDQAKATSKAIKTKAQDLFDDAMSTPGTNTQRREKKTQIRELTKRLMSDKKGNLPEYRELLVLLMKHVIPRFENTRRVQIKQLPSGDWIISCSCPMHKKFGHGCRHIYTVLKRHPKITDAKVRWHIGYIHHYGRHEQMSQHYLKLSDLYEKLGGIPITEDEVNLLDSMEIGHGEAPLEFFESSLDKLKLRGQCTYWQGMGEMFPQYKKYPLCFECTDTLEQATGHSEEACSDVQMSDSDTNGKLPHVPQESMLQAGVFGSSQVMSSQSEYMVPSQQAQDADMSRLAEPISDSDLGITTTGNNYNDFMHMYAQIAKQALLKRGLHRTRTELYALGMQDLKPTGMNSGPIHVKKPRNHRRIKKVGSPDRKLRRSKRKRTDG